MDGEMQVVRAKYWPIKRREFFVGFGVVSGGFEFFFNKVIKRLKGKSFVCRYIGR